MYLRFHNRYMIDTIFIIDTIFVHFKILVCFYKYFVRIIMYVSVAVQSLSCVQLSATPWTVAHQAFLSIGFSRQEYRSGSPRPPPGDLPDPGIEPVSPASQADSLPSEPPWKPPLQRKVEMILCKNLALTHSGRQHSIDGCKRQPFRGPAASPRAKTKLSVGVLSAFIKRHFAPVIPPPLGRFIVCLPHTFASGCEIVRSS